MISDNSFSVNLSEPSRWFLILLKQEKAIQEENGKLTKKVNSYDLVLLALHNYAQNTNVYIRLLLRMCKFVLKLNLVMWKKIDQGKGEDNGPAGSVGEAKSISKFVNISHASGKSLS